MTSQLACPRRRFLEEIFQSPANVESVADIFIEYNVFSYLFIAFMVICGAAASFKVYQATKKQNIKQTKHQNVQRTFNLIFLGETGVGKSTLINAFINYLKHPKFDSAKRCKMEYTIPYNFNVKCGKKSDGTSVDDNRNNIDQQNEVLGKKGESVTQKPQKHVLSFENYDFQIIDTPGLNDSRGRNQDIKNLNYIKDFLKDIDRIDAICLVMHSNQTKLTKEFENSLYNLLSLFSNVYFFFTYANVTLFNIGVPMTAILQFCEKYNLVNPLNPNHFYLVDNESYKYLLASQQNVEYSSPSEDTLKKIWEKSSEDVHRFFEFLRM